MEYTPESDIVQTQMMENPKKIRLCPDLENFFSFRSPRSWNEGENWAGSKFETRAPPNGIPFLEGPQKREIPCRKRSGGASLKGKWKDARPTSEAALGPLIQTYKRLDDCVKPLSEDQPWNHYIFYIFPAESRSFAGNPKSVAAPCALDVRRRSAIQRQGLLNQQ